MIETQQPQTTLAERQEHIHRFITRWKAERKKADQAHEAWVKTPEFATIVNKLKERNAANGISTPGL